MTARLEELVALTARIGDPTRDFVILAEGNTSSREDEETFWVKASGRTMESPEEATFVRVRFEPVISALDLPRPDDLVLRSILNGARRDPDVPAVPSTEAFMHAWLLTLPGVEFVVHTHPTPLLSLLALEDAEELASQRMFPDEIVCCGPATCFVPYVAPGFDLAVAIRERTRGFAERWGDLPRTYWLHNHGLITVGKTAADAESATRMAVKAARAWLGALQTGRSIRPLSPGEVRHIHAWPDEHYRQKLLAGL
ncbi:MAG: class II aldolase/adducin family protein [Fimbriimonadaceae bacterium]|nr:class II aldolase/adducin family protein [Fimbriimonadaceae bacterium]